MLPVGIHGHLFPIGLMKLNQAELRRRNRQLNYLMSLSNLLVRLQTLTLQRQSRGDAFSFSRPFERGCALGGFRLVLLAQRKVESSGKIWKRHYLISESEGRTLRFDISHACWR
jgi:hypothetical protein